MKNSSAQTPRPVTTTALLTALPALFAACMTDRVPLPAERPAATNQVEYLVKKITFDDHGRPLFAERLDRRPGEEGTSVTVVQTTDGLPSRSYDIAVVDRPRAGPAFLAVIYAWTGKGRESGVKITLT